MPMIPRNRRLLAFVSGLLVLNLILSFTTGGPPSRAQVPYQPFFVDQLQKDNIRPITPRGASIEGELIKKVKYDAEGDKGPVDVDRFKTLVPAFINRAALTKLVSDNNVVVNAKPPETGRGFLS